MGLTLTVGILIGPEAEDPEEFASWDTQFTYLNHVLDTKSLPHHQEPVGAYEGLPWVCDMYGYSGLHYLRRIAAYIAAGSGIPNPGDDHAPDDPVLQQYYLRSSANDVASRFPHLMRHSDCEGFYLPLPFSEVIVSDEKLPVCGEFIGSATTLLDECKTLTQILQIPPDLDAEAEEIEDAATYQGEGAEQWQRYGVESLTCLRLMKACQLSLTSGCAIVLT